MKKLIIPLPYFFKNLISNFIRCGITGWCLEIIFTAFGSLRRREMTLFGQTSLWMFPIYGSVSLFKPFILLIKKGNILLRGITYAACIFTGEFISGTLLQQRSLCPWNYSRHKWHVKGLIRLDYLPFWFMAGLIFEKVLTSKNAGKALPGRKYNASC